MTFPTQDTYNFQGIHAELIAARLAYIAQHGARWLFNNQPPPAPGYPTLRMGKIVRRGVK